MTWPHPLSTLSKLKTSHTVFGDDQDTDEEEEEEEEEGEEEAPLSPQPPLLPASQPTAPAQARSSFDEIYKPSELTEFDSLFTRNMVRTAE